MNSTIDLIKTKLGSIFSLQNDKDDEEYIIQSIRDDIDFKGVRIWILICAIFTASLGLNVNSTAVIIGAMLISPLMNPIVGLGLGLGIYDLRLVRRSLKSLGIMVIISLTTATLYFLISPLSLAQSELLARTQPTIYDVLIAIAGGAAGILANSTKIKGNILMGVAIATALMPPLCTAGYGLSQGNWSYFLGAGYLFTINAIFIALSTLAVVRLLKFAPHTFLSQERERKIHRWIIGITVAVMLPSLYSGFILVRHSIQEDAINRFVRDRLNGEHYQTLRHNLIQTDSMSYLDVALLGRKIEEPERDSLERLMQQEYKLSGVKLVLRQDFMSSADSADIRLSRELLEKQLYHRQDELLARQQRGQDSLRRLLDAARSKQNAHSAIESELPTLFPEVQICRIVETDIEETPLVLVTYQGRTELPRASRERIEAWLSARLGIKHIEFHRLQR